MPQACTDNLGYNFSYLLICEQRHPRKRLLKKYNYLFLNLNIRTIFNKNIWVIIWSKSMTSAILRSIYTSHGVQVLFLLLWSEIIRDLEVFIFPKHHKLWLSLVDTAAFLQDRVWCIVSSHQVFHSASTVLVTMATRTQQALGLLIIFWQCSKLLLTLFSFHYY
jgi:hypothetical protein